MKKIFVFAGSLILLLSFFACDDEPTEPEEKSKNVAGLSYVTYQDSVELTWNNAEAAVEDNFLGYHVFKGDGESLVDDTLDTLNAVNDTFITDTTLVINGLSTAEIYYFHVRGAWGSMDTYAYGERSKELDTSPVLVERNNKIWEYASDTANTPSAFDFAGGQSLEMDPAYADSIHIYLDSLLDDSRTLVVPQAIPDSYGDTSPWQYKSTEIVELGSSNWYEYNVANDANWDGDNFKVKVEAGGQVFAVKTTNNHYIKIEIDIPGGTKPNRYIEFNYAYQSIPNYDNF